MRQTQILRRARKAREYDEPAAIPVTPASSTEAAAAVVEAIDSLLES